MSKTLLVCDCLGSQNVDAGALSAATGLSCKTCYSSLCMDQVDIASKAIANGDVVIACQQEADRFAAIAEDLGAPEPQFVDIRDRAGWSDDVQERSPKMAALLADALLLTPATKPVDHISQGRCLSIDATYPVLQAA